MKRNEADTRADLIDPKLATAGLGSTDKIRETFVNFQKYLYQFSS